MLMKSGYWLMISIRMAPSISWSCAVLPKDQGYRQQTFSAEGKMGGAGSSPVGYGTWKVKVRLETSLPVHLETSMGMDGMILFLWAAMTPIRDCLGIPVTLIPFIS